MDAGVEVEVDPQAVSVAMTAQHNTMKERFASIFRLPFGCKVSFFQENWTTRKFINTFIVNRFTTFLHDTNHFEVCQYSDK